MSGRLHLASSSAARLAHVTTFIGTQRPATEIVLVAASRGAADDVARHVARARLATIGLHRFSLTQLAARLGATRLAGRGLVPATRLATEAVAARAVFEARRDERLGLRAGRQYAGIRALARPHADRLADGLRRPGIGLGRR